MKSFNISFLVFLLFSIFQSNNSFPQESYAEEIIDQSSFVYAAEVNPRYYSLYFINERYNLQVYPGQNVLGLNYNPYCTSSDFKYFGRYFTNCKNNFSYLASHFESNILQIRSNAFGDNLRIVRSCENEFSKDLQHPNCNTFYQNLSGKSNSDIMYSKLYTSMKAYADELVRKNEIKAHNNGYALRQGRISVPQNGNYSQAGYKGSGNKTYNNSAPRNNSSKRTYSTPTSYRGSGSFRPKGYNTTIRTSSTLTK